MFLLERGAKLAVSYRKILDSLFATLFRAGNQEVFSSRFVSSTSIAYLLTVLHKTRMPFFTIVMCTFNRALLLPRAVESVLKQVEEDWELVVVDDGSTDDSFSVLKTFAESDRRIRYQYQSNAGIGNARTNGALSARGLFVTFLDSDDEYLPNHLALRRDVLQSYPEVEFLHGGIIVVGDEYVPDKNDHTKLVHLDECVVGGTFVIRADIVRELGGFGDYRFADDSHFFDRALDTGVSIGKIYLPTYKYYRDTPDSLCNVNQNQHHKSDRLDSANTP